MTLFLPLETTTPLPSSPSFLTTAGDRNAQMTRVVHAMMKAKRMVIICGAGISVQAGIPDFRSSDGLFKSLKRDHPRESLSSGKDLFDASVFSSEHTTSLFCQMMAQLSDLSQNAEPTSFHHLLRALDERGRLLRVYTQNIDAIEQKSGLSFGVPEFDDKRWKARLKGKSKEKVAHTSSSSSSSGSSQSQSSQPEASTSRLPTPSTETPRCIPLHGTLQAMHCQICHHSSPLQDHLASLSAGQPPQCPECTKIQHARQLIGKRPRRVGKLRPSVVLYNETHQNGESVGDVVQKDLIGSSKGKGKSGADFLLVVGTSLKVPGTKRMVREFAKAVKSRGVNGSSSSLSTKDEGTSNSSTPNGSPRRSPSEDEEPPPAPMKAVYLNLDFPVPTREWEGVFDAWVQGDAQAFSEILHEEIRKEAKAKEVANEKKRKKEEEAAAAAAAAMEEENEIVDVEMRLPTPPPLPSPAPTPKRKSKSKASSITTPKRQRTTDDIVSTPRGARSAKSNTMDDDVDMLPTPSATSTAFPVSTLSSASHREQSLEPDPVTLSTLSAPLSLSGRRNHGGMLPTPEATPVMTRKLPSDPSSSQHRNRKISPSLEISPTSYKTHRKQYNDSIRGGASASTPRSTRGGANRFVQEEDDEDGVSVDIMDDSDSNSNGDELERREWRDRERGSRSTASSMTGLLGQAQSRKIDPAMVEELLRIRRDCPMPMYRPPPSLLGAHVMMESSMRSTLTLEDNELERAISPQLTV